MIYFLYNFLLYFLSILAIPYFLYNFIFHKEEWRQRLGQFSDEDFATSKNPIWIHAASMGEVVGISPVVKKLKEKYPQIPLIISTMTLTGNQKANQLFKEVADKIFIMPLDLDFAIQNTFQRVNPRLILIAETELWANFLRTAQEKNCPVIIANGRISDKSFPQYKKFRPLIKRVTKNISLFCAQSELDEKRIFTLGLEKEKIKICGNCKFDFPLPERDSELRKKFFLPEKDLIWIAGSTRPGEEEIILQTFAKLKNKFKNLRLILAPRHLMRLSEVENIIEKHDFSWVKRSEITAIFDKEIYLLDTMGELTQIYGTADLAFVGGTLKPFGGHNPLEPAMYGVPVIFGKYTNNARDSFSALIKFGGGREIDEGNIYEIVTSILSDNKKLESMGKNAKSVILSNRGASDKILEEIEKFLHKN